jgi:peptide/nickel transport system ATP-binding protein
MEAILSVRDLIVGFRGTGGPVRAVDGVSFDIYPGETLGIIGESGSGKSVTALAMLSLIQRRSLAVLSGQALFNGKDLLSMDRRQVRGIRGSEIAMIFQEPMTSLNPVLRVGWQIAEVLVRHRDLSRRDAMRTAIELMDQVGIPACEKRAMEYPYQLSGGMRQRIMIAMAMACQPKLLIADEPTTALDVTVQAQILSLIDELKRRSGTSIMLITHDFGVVAQATDRTAVMYGGRLVEQSETIRLFEAPRHPYSAALISAIPRLGAKKPGVNVRLPEVPGVVPRLVGGHHYCSFAPRCAYRFRRCLEAQPGLTNVQPNGKVRCFLYEAS